VLKSALRIGASVVIAVTSAWSSAIAGRRCADRRRQVIRDGAETLAELWLTPIAPGSIYAGASHLLSGFEKFVRRHRIERNSMSGFLSNTH
jgi:hypothetical protein